MTNLACGEPEVQVDHAPIVSQTPPPTACIKCGAEAIYIEQQEDQEGTSTVGTAIHCLLCGCTMYFQPGMRKRKYPPLYSLIQRS